MGFGSSKNKKPQEKPITAQDLKILINISKLKCKLYSNQKKNRINNIKKEIANCLKKNEIDLSKTKMENIFKNENYIKIYNILESTLEIIKENCNSIITNTECPAELRASLDTILYPATRLEINELIEFREKIKNIYGTPYVTRVDNNIDKLVNKNLVELLELLESEVFSDEIISERLKQFCIQNKIKCSLNNDIIEDDVKNSTIPITDSFLPPPVTDLINPPEDKPNPFDDPFLPKPKINPTPDPIDIDDIPTTLEYYKVITQITSDINGLFCKTKVLQIFSNPTNNPLELKIYILKKKNILFSSFNCQIGDSIKVKSKVIKEEKAKEKYVDSIASGNAAIFVSHDPYDKNKIIIHMGNIPPNKDVVFESNFISPIETSNNKYEFEIFRNLPIFVGKNEEIYQNSGLTGEIIIKSNNKIINIEDNILMENLKIIEEKESSENYFTYTIKYVINELPSFNWYNSDDYIPSSKIYFDLDTKQPIALVQESIKKSQENFYFLQYRFKLDKPKESNQEMSPSLFIFLLDQSGSMSGQSIRIASQALIIFLQSIPVGSYYQIIGFGSTFEKYDKIPKEYNKENIKQSIDIIKNLSANLGGTDIYNPLKNIYDSKDYDNINLPKNIFLLTDGEVEDKDKVLNLIEENNNRFIIYSIGIGNNFDEDLIENAGIMGKGNYNFCKEMDKLYSIIVSEINKCCNPFISEIKINCNLDNNKIKNIIPNIIKDNDLINLYYIINNNIIENIKLKIKSKDIKNIEHEENYEIIPEKLEKGDDLSKLIIYNYIKNNKNLTEKEKIDLAIKYQIFIEGTSLFAETELDEKISDQMKSEILGHPETNKASYAQGSFNANPYGPSFGGDFNPYGGSIINENNNPYGQSLNNNTNPFGGSIINENNNPYGPPYNNNSYRQSYNNNADPFGGSTINENNNPFESLSNPEFNASTNYCKNEVRDPFEFNGDIFGDENSDMKCMNIENKEESVNKKTDKDDFMEMINSQDFIEGYWEENEYTKKVIEKYEKEYKLLKEIKNKSINEKVALTVLVIYYINKEHSESLDALLLIIKKAKKYIEKVTNNSYENIIQEIKIN